MAVEGRLWAPFWSMQVEQNPNSKEYKACTMGAVDQFLPVGVAEGAGTVHAWSGGR